MRRPLSACAVAVLSIAVAAGSCEDPADPPSPEPSTPAPEVVDLTLGVYGPEPELEAFAAIVDDINAESEATIVELQTWPDAASMNAEFEAGAERPDVFMLNRQDLAGTLAEDVTAPVTLLLDERGVDFGDGYSRDALLGFSDAGELQCMPYSISPQVMYVNRDLIDFGRMALQGLPVPAPDTDRQFALPGEEPDEESPTAPTDPLETESEAGDELLPELADAAPLTYRRWNFEQFQAAAGFAADPRSGVKGVHVAPTFEGIEPFMYSVSTSLFDDSDDPTSLQFEEAADSEAFATLLGVLRDPQLTPTPDELAGTTPLQLFRQGRLGMLPGFRSLVPVLRNTDGLNFDIMPIPSLNNRATVGDIEGFCLTAGTGTVPRAADLLVRLISQENVARVVEVGYRVPTNLDVLQSSDFLDPGQMPNNSRLFSSALRDVQEEPLLLNRQELVDAVNPLIRKLINRPVLSDPTPLAASIDARSSEILDPVPPEDLDQSEEPDSGS